jgi:NADH-quinone oxidoreductase subunit E
VEIEIEENSMLEATERSKEERMQGGFSNFKVELWKYQGEAGALIPLLQSAQETYGYIPESAIDHISEIVRIPSADIYGVITFYSQFRLKPMGRNIIKICDGTACHVNASSTIIKTIEDELNITNNETTDDGLFTLEKVACLGCCSLSPVVMINGETYGRLTPKKVQQLLKEYRERSAE